MSGAAPRADQFNLLNNKFVRFLVRHHRETPHFVAFVDIKVQIPVTSCLVCQISYTLAHT